MNREKIIEIIKNNKKIIIIVILIGIGFIPFIFPFSLKIEVLIKDLDNHMRICGL